MTDRLLQLLRDQGVDAAIQFAIASPDAPGAVTAMDELMRDCYWKQKDLASSVKIGVAAASYALSAADKMSPDQSEVAAALRGKAKTIYYNLASFTWRGWGEIGIETRPYEITVGLDAARENLRLAVELKKGDLPMSRAHWMLAALQMSAKDFRAADYSFGKAVQFARFSTPKRLAVHACVPSDVREDRGRSAPSSYSLKGML
jgi:hypothetical protein